MPEFRAKEFLDMGIAVMVNGMLRFTQDQTHLGYNTAAPYVRFAGRQSGYAGPQTMQFFRPKFEL